jgi:hypothetical protein
MNLLLMLAVLFAVSYQSIHTFSHDHHLAHSCGDEADQKSNYKINFSETEECPVCEFKFASFLAPEITTFIAFEPYFEIPYQFNVIESSKTFKGKSNPLRGPPAVV